MDTTGQIIATHQASGAKILIAIDRGPYPGCKPEYNVRKLEQVRVLNISITDPAYEAAISDKAGYGCGWGDTGKLYPVTQADIDRMVDAHNRRQADRDKREAAELAEEIAITEARRRHPGWCDKCGSYCYRDC